MYNVGVSELEELWGEDDEEGDDENNDGGEEKDKKEKWWIKKDMISLSIPFNLNTHLIFFMSFSCPSPSLDVSPDRALKQQQALCYVLHGQ